MKLNRFLEDEISLGKGSVKIPSAEMISRYRERYKIMQARGLKFKFTLHYVMPGGRIIVHVKVPSETVPNFHYSVLLELNTHGGAKKFEDCHIKVFSNCPSFVFTYAYVFYHLPDDELGKPTMMIDDFSQKIPKNRLMVPGTEDKLGEDVLTNRPVVRNPYGLPLFDKSIYYAVFFILENLDFNRTLYNKHISTIDSIMRDIEDFDAMMARRRSVEQKERDRNRRISRDTASTMRSIEREVAKNAGVRKIRPTVKSRSQAIKKTKSEGTRRIKSK